MPIIKSAIKRVKQAAKRNAQNVATKKDIKAATKAFLLKPTAQGLSEVQSAIDTAVKKNVLEKNTAARRKAQYAKVAKDAGVKATGAAKAAPKTAAKATAAKTATKKPAAKTTTKAAPKAAAKPAAKKAPAKKPAAKKTAK